MSAIAAARTALGTGAWRQATEGFRAVVRQDDDPAAYEGLAQTAWWLDDAETCLRAREQAYRRYRDLGDDRAAARVAAALGYDALLFGEGAGVAGGWLGRAADLMEPLAESSEHGWLAVRQAETALAVSRDPVAVRAAAERAIAVGRRQRDGDLEVVGTALLGLAEICAGDVVAGMARLDTAVAAATGGDVEDLMWLGKICCWLIVACQQTRDVGRAADWCRRVEAMCVERDLAPLFTVCRIQYAALQVSQGTWPEAERELTSVLSALGTSRRASRLDAVVQLGELRRRQGRPAEAEALLRQAEFHPVAVVGRALLRLADGDPDGAWAAVAALLEALPVANRLDRVAALPAAVVTALAAGETGCARHAAAELRETAEAVGTEALLGAAAAADAALAPDRDAVRWWSEAVRRFQAAGLRFDEAEGRLNLAQALLATGDRAAAHEQADAAVLAFTELDAGVELARARRVRAASGDGPRPITARETEVLRLVARGLSNGEIARVLVLSEHTVHRHVANILTKLGQPTRAAATAHALTSGLI